jgi:hypothetical protein
MSAEDFKTLEPSVAQEMRETIVTRGDPTKTRLAVLPDEWIDGASRADTQGICSTYSPFAIS